MPLIDRFGRVHDDLRVSVTDRCNLRCSYCMPEEPEWYPRAAILTFEELERVCGIAAGEGVRTLRITGGEPLVRKDLPDLVARLARVPGIADLSLTTNGALLAGSARELAAAGLKRINVSLDTLDRGRFATLTGRDQLDAVIRGIDAALAAGLAPIKLNAVLIPGANDGEAVDLVRFARERGLEIRFIERMPLANDRSWSFDGLVTGATVRSAIAEVWPIVPDPRDDPHAPATRWLFEDGTGAIGFIDSVTAPFCAACSRLRLTSDGKFRVCLYDDRETDLRALLRGAAADATIAEAMRGALAHKGRGGALDILESRSSLPLVRTMHQIGG